MSCDNIEFLNRWPTGEGRGWVAFNKATEGIYRGTYHNYDDLIVGFIYLEVKFSNIAGNAGGTCEIWRNDIKTGPHFTNEKYVFDSLEELKDSLNLMYQRAIDKHQENINSLTDTMLKIKQSRVTYAL